MSQGIIFRIGTKQPKIIISLNKTVPLVYNVFQAFLFIILETILKVESSKCTP